MGEEKPRQSDQLGGSEPSVKRWGLAAGLKRRGETQTFHKSLLTDL